MYVFVINTGSVYANTVLCAVLAGLAHIFVGAISMMVLFYSIKTNFADSHVIFCTLGVS